jgi:hypothetical protein
VFLLCREHDPCSLYLGAMITGMGIFIGCGYGSETGIGVSTLTCLSECSQQSSCPWACTSSHLWASCRLNLKWEPPCWDVHISCACSINIRHSTEGLKRRCGDQFSLLRLHVPLIVVPCSWSFSWPSGYYHSKCLMVVAFMVTVPQKGTIEQQTWDIDKQHKLCVGLECDSRLHHHW